MTELADVLKALDAATVAHNSALNAEGEARRNATITLNALNSAQKAFDEYVAGLKRQSPRGSDWSMRQMKPERVAA